MEHADLFSRLHKLSGGGSKLYRSGELPQGLLSDHLSMGGTTIRVSLCLDGVYDRLSAEVLAEAAQVLVGWGMISAPDPDVSDERLLEHLHAQGSVGRIWWAKELAKDRLLPLAVERWHHDTAEFVLAVLARPDEYPAFTS